MLGNEQLVAACLQVAAITRCRCEVMILVSVAPNKGLRSGATSFTQVVVVVASHCLGSHNCTREGVQAVGRAQLLQHLQRCCQ
jgi:hypothetical protein